MLTLPLRLLLAVFVAFRLARLIAVDEGPGGLCLWFRLKAGAYDLGPDSQPQTNLGRGIICPYCMGVWAAALTTALVWFPSRVGDVFLVWVGTAGAQSALEDRG